MNSRKSSLILEPISGAPQFDNDQLFGAEIDAAVSANSSDPESVDGNVVDDVEQGGETPASAHVSDA